MNNKRLLVIAPYPIQNPQHGGQKRVKALVEQYKKVFSHVECVAVYSPLFYEDYGPKDVHATGKEVDAKIKGDPDEVEYIIADAIVNNIHVRNSLAERLIELRPDVVHVEQPFMYKNVDDLLKKLRMKPVLIYGSQNVEYKMKEVIYEDKAESNKYKALVRRTYEIEKYAIQNANLVLVVSEADKREAVVLGARKCLVVPNGIEELVWLPKDQRHWSNYKKKKKLKQLAVFVGSGHPPNWKGYLEMMGEDSSFLPVNTQLIIAGGVSNYMRTYYKRSHKLWRRADGIGIVSESRLTSLINEAEVIILPITQGGGSNLKTAEALHSLKKIVATSYAFRGYEEYMSLPNVVICDEAKLFRQAVVSALKSPVYVPTESDKILTKRVLWRKTLEPLYAIPKLLGIRLHLATMINIPAVCYNHQKIRLSKKINR